MSASAHRAAHAVRCSLRRASKPSLSAARAAPIADRRLGLPRGEPAYATTRSSTEQPARSYDLWRPAARIEPGLAVVRTHVYGPSLPPTTVAPPGGAVIGLDSPSRQPRARARMTAVPGLAIDDSDTSSSR